MENVKRQGSIIKQNDALHEKGFNTTLDCPECGGAVTNRHTLNTYDYRFRRKYCTKCSYSFLTVELLLEDIEQFMKGGE